MWGGKVSLVSPYPLFIGASLAICAFLWDMETNAATALLWFWPGLTPENLLGTMFNPLALLFAVAHEAADFAFGATVAPLMILAIAKMKARW